MLRRLSVVKLTLRLVTVQVEACVEVVVVREVKRTVLVAVVGTVRLTTE